VEPSRAEPPATTTNGHREPLSGARRALPPASRMKAAEQRLRNVRFGFLAAFTMAGQQSQFQGSVPTGTASPTPLALTLHDAIDRGLKANLGLLVSDSASEAARGQRLQALSALLPQSMPRLAKPWNSST
jgi:hypothetical protein